MRYIPLLFILALVTSCGTDNTPFIGSSSTTTSSGSSSSTSGGSSNTTTTTNTGSGSGINLNKVQLVSKIPIGDSLANKSLHMSDSGNMIVFASSADLTGDNPNNNAQVFTINQGTLSQLTSDSDDVRPISDPSLIGSFNNFSLSHDGSRLAWSGSGDKIIVMSTSGNTTTINSPGVGTLEINALDIADGTGPVTYQVRRIENLVDIYEAYSSTTDGSNASTQLSPINEGISLIRSSSNGNSIVLLDINNKLHLMSPGDTTTTIIDTATDEVKMSTDGNVIVFNSTNDITGGNSDGSEEIFSYNKTTTQYTQLTNNWNFPIVQEKTFDISGDGSTLVYIERETSEDDPSEGTFSIYSLPINSPATVTTVLQTRLEPNISAYSLGQISSDYTGSKFVFVSNYQFNLITSGDDATEQIYTVTP